VGLTILDKKKQLRIEMKEKINEKEITIKDIYLQILAKKKFLFMITFLGLILSTIYVGLSGKKYQVQLVLKPGKFNGILIQPEKLLAYRLNSLDFYKNEDLNVCNGSKQIDPNLKFLEAHSENELILINLFNSDKDKIAACINLIQHAIKTDELEIIEKYQIEIENKIKSYNKVLEKINSTGEEVKDKFLKERNKDSIILTHLMDQKVQLTEKIIDLNHQKNDIMNSEFYQISNPEERLNSISKIIIGTIIFFMIGFLLTFFI
jgi:hypothetical protein